MAKIQSQKVKNPALEVATQEMGRGWPKKLAEMTGFKRTYIRDAVKFQRLDAQIWDAVEELKKQRKEFLKANKQKINKTFKKVLV